MDARAYVQLTKPGITLFIGMSAAVGFIVADDAVASPARLLLAVTATMAMSGGAAALNQIAERDSDARMTRTCARVLPSGRLDVRQARVFAYTVSSLGLLLSLSLLPTLTTVLLGLSHLTYVHWYTPLKRRTPLCTLVGAIPGALPVLAGATAATGSINAAGLALAGVLFTWQIPHFMAIGFLAREDYASVGCPMLSVVDPSGTQSASVSLLYALTMLGCALLVGVSTGGVLFPLAALATGGAYVLAAWRFHQQRRREYALRLFVTSIIALPILLAALATEQLAL